jgi:flagellar biosynthesis/type III secretory pathway protein FliH
VTLYLVHADDHVLLTSDRPVIKRADRQPLESAVAAFQDAAALRTRTAAAAEAARREGYEAGLAEARRDAAALIVEGLADVAASIAQHAEARRADIADAAFAATRAIIGDLDSEDVVGRIVDRTLARLDGDAPVTIDVSPAMADPLTQRLAASPHVTIVADSTLGDTECRIRGAQGQIVASLAVQLDALAARWGIVARATS